ncbi:dimethylhistidine N-methyltransferase [Dulcicalothrix desertica PCC 7102]|uniref:Dimethylhistidine N-methyltransferase n=1 Tax=Dulcicalothrix desertica PCC 7102 TaxID=232991 RepID=A0A433VPC2_9CYAN|nr:L-histidine N(alpha)-methyltransferase [Dulcicalothrix desertica]RUT07954.1 dimethylhistidine N-methyltransferase [Dulcicalothrix desertica PCC 7102]TWH39476.1 dimethylhistidine N-methyltransferase [Dulcicalothrix desertica PCC 7102]
MTISNTNSSQAMQQQIEKRLKIQHLRSVTASLTTTAGSDVVKGLTQTAKTLPPRYFYDDRGSDLFEQICELPEYYVTRTETAILQACASDIAEITKECELVELGSGSSTKTRILLDAYQNLGLPLRYLPIDVSAGMLENSAKQLLLDYPTLEINALAGTYELALHELPAKQLPSRIIAFIGSTLGNLNPQESEVFFSQITQALHSGEYFLLGIDLQKPKHILEAAYNDSQGVTAAFNLNMLEHINWLYNGNFDTTQFEHFAFYNDTENQIEMHLRSLKSQNVKLEALNISVDIKASETIMTEISRKFDIATIKQQLSTHGLITQKVWTDTNNWFGLLLCQLQ